MSTSTIFLDLKSIQELADGHEFARGEEYCQRGRVRNLILEDGVYRRLLDLDGDLGLASVHSSGTVESPQLEVELQGRT